MCFIRPGQLSSCTCTKECGCGGGETEPEIIKSCPSKDKPKVVDCSDKIEYCALGDDNTMCKYCGVGPACSEAFCANELSDADIKDLLDKHNELRAKVANGLQDGQPSATNMKKLKWDTELARIGKKC